MKNEFEQTYLKEADKRKIYFSIIESLLFASGDPLKVKDIASILECSIEYTEQLLKKLNKTYDAEERGIKLISINNAYQLVTKKGNSSYLQKLLKTNVRQSLSQASLETLAIIAYKQPVTRINIDEIRGVKSDSAIITLIDKKLIKEVGKLEVPGRPILYATTDEFLRYFGIENIKEMPSIETILKEFKEENEISNTAENIEINDN